jgi:hypothetical protein
MFRIDAASAAPMNANGPVSETMTDLERVGRAGQLRAGRRQQKRTAERERENAT